MIFQSKLIQSLETHGNKIAIESTESAISYSNLLLRADKITRSLLRRGILPETLVGIKLHRRIDIICAMIGIANARCVFVPIDSSLPDVRLFSMLKDLNFNYILSERSYYTDGSLNDLSADMLILDDLLEDQDNSRPIYPTFDANDGLYVYFTSGSTGKPKAILGKNKSLLHFLLWEIETFNITSNYRISQLISPYFDAFLRDVFVPLLVGGTICIAPDEDNYINSEKIINWIDTSAINLIHCVPSFFRLINQEFVTRDLFRNLNYVLLSGEKINPLELKNWYKIFGADVQLVNLYGTTETTMIRSYYRIKPEDVNQDKISIGDPIWDTNLLILNKDFEVCPVLVPGDLYIATEFLTKGYLNAPESNQEKFLTLYPGTEKEISAFKTGDKARKLISGGIDLIGREDRQVKLRGIRIELDEIENTLFKSEYVRNAVVIKHLQEQNNELLIAFVICNEPGLDVKIIQTFLEEQLPSYMVPSRILIVSEFPLLSNGKINFQGLSAQFESRDYILPTNEFEDKILSLWKEIIGDKQISIDDNFNVLGGNSLNVMKLITKLFKAFNVRISLGDFFKNMTIRKQAELILKLMKVVPSLGLKSPGFLPIKKTEQKARYKLSSPQLRLYLLHQFDKTSLAYNLLHALKLEGELNKSQLQKVFVELIHRHESLRTRFYTKDADHFQEIMSDVSFNIQYFTSNGEDVDEIIRKFSVPFDLSQCPLLRVGIVTISETDHILIVDMHHIVTDGLSYGILISDFMALYNNEVLETDRLKYSDYLAWLEEGHQQKEILSQKEFWLKEFATEPSVLELPTDYARPKIKTSSGGSFELDLKMDQAVQLKSMADQAETTLFVVLLSIYNILLNKLSNQEDIIIGVPVSGRQHPDLEGIIGMFVNTLPLRNYPSGTKKFFEFLEEVKSNSLVSFDNQSYPIELLLDELSLVRDTSRNPLFEVMFAYENATDVDLKIPGLRLQSYKRKHNVSKFDLSLIVREQQGKLYLNIEYSTALFNEDSIAKIAEYLKRIVSEVIADPSVLISEINILSAAEENDFLKQYNLTESLYYHEQTITELFEEQVRKNPDSVALQHEQKVYTYLELHSDIAKMTVYLMEEKGVKAGDLVGLLLDREAYVVICMFAILKSGASFVPIDINTPQDRINNIVEDSGIHVLITRKQFVQGFGPVKSIVADLDQILENLSQQQITEKFNTYHPESLAYVIFTSGTTGKPKGVMIENKSLVNYLSWAIQHYLKSTDKDFAFPLYTSLSFDLTLTSVFMPLLSGNRLVIYGEDDQEMAVLKVMNENKVDIIKLTPSHLKVIKESNFRPSESANRLKKMIVGGEGFDFQLAKYIYDLYNGKIEIFNEYGPTEATIGCMIHDFNPAESGLTVPIGRPIANTQIYLLDKYLKPVPVGCKGEMYLSGDGLARGYLSGLDLTNEKFIPNPYLPGKKMYKTGDIAKRLPDGNLMFLERADKQLKIRGFRIELGEIEFHLQNHKEITEAIVLAYHKGAEAYLVAYYLSDAEIEDDNLNHFLNGCLPHYMIPAIYFHLEKIPLNLNGKVDISALPDPESRAIDYFKTPSGVLEEKLVRIWSEILGIDESQISVNSSFFELGGNSLKIIRLSTIINQEFNWKISVPQIFQYSSISSLVKFINEGGTDTEGAVKEASDEITAMSAIINSFE
ncbi:amino acid adenylation domain-containing protein [Pedobacter psychrotolerans]|uniref:amino acid adenylation domain-containing protein n=1 Tax=Pedobacter psychrotolerans TaxID=1843235 RepID=UPI003F9A330A